MSHLNNSSNHPLSHFLQWEWMYRRFSIPVPASSIIISNIKTKSINIYQSLHNHNTESYQTRWTYRKLIELTSSTLSFPSISSWFSTTSLVNCSSRLLLKSHCSVKWTVYETFLREKTFASNWFKVKLA